MAGQFCQDVPVQVSNVPIELLYNSGIDSFKIDERSRRVNPSAIRFEYFEESKEIVLEKIDDYPGEYGKPNFKVKQK